MPFIEIKVPTFNIKGLEDALLRTFSGRARENERILRNTTQNFKTVKPVFQSEIKVTQEDIEIITAPIDDENGFGEIWSYLDQGTAVRRALLSADYQAGTQPGTFETTKAQGTRTFVSRELERPGIEARGWTDLLADTGQTVFANTISRGLSSFINRWSKS